VFQYLRGRQHESAVGQWNQDVDAAETLGLLPQEVIGDYLNAIQEDWVPAKQWDPAERMLADILALSDLDEGLRKRASELLKVVCDSRKRLIGPMATFPKRMEPYREFSERVRAQRNLLGEVA
jgi:hypothetical protein